VKYIFIFVISISSLNLYSQTKAETETWLISKFNKFKFYTIEDNVLNKDKIQLYTDDPISLDIKNCQLVIKQIRSYPLSSESTTMIYYIDIGDIDVATWKNSTGYKFFITSKKEIKIKSYSDIKYVKYIYTKGMEFGINHYVEDNFKERFLKAFTHLRSFCQPSISPKEVF
jgi:hypothetical protein